jgi:hypothetical protein
MRLLCNARRYLRKTEVLFEQGCTSLQPGWTTLGEDEAVGCYHVHRATDKEILFWEERPHFEFPSYWRMGMKRLGRKLELESVVELADNPNAPTGKAVTC